MFFSASPPRPTTVSYKFIAIQFDRRNRNDVTDVMTFVVHDVPFPKIVSVERETIPSKLRPSFVRNKVTFLCFFKTTPASFNLFLSS